LCLKISRRGKAPDRNVFRVGRAALIDIVGDRQGNSGNGNVGPAKLKDAAVLAGNCNRIEVRRKNGPMENRVFLAGKRRVFDRGNPGGQSIDFRLGGKSNWLDNIAE